MKMKMYYLIYFLIYTISSFTNVVIGRNCEKLTKLSGEIHNSCSYTNGNCIKCWLIEIPQDSYMRLNFTEFDFPYSYCDYMRVNIFITGVNETYKFCKDTDRHTIFAVNDVNVTYYHSIHSYSSSFRLRFIAENFICAQKDHFRCSPNYCIPNYLVCNGVKDCENGIDESRCERKIAAIKGMNASRINAIHWLMDQKTQPFGWGKNTHRAITALYLSKAMTFQGDDFEEELFAKQLELQTSLTLMRNLSDPISIGELSMFVNALTVTCHNPRRFYGYDLVQILSDRVASARSPVPSAYLTLCIRNWTLSNSDVKSLVNLLQKNSKYPFRLDVRALTIMALKCIKDKTKHFKDIVHAESTYETSIRNFAGQLVDGSFGNVYTTALVTQALIASGQEQSKHWNATAAVGYLMKQLNSTSIDFLSVYLTLPVFSGRSLVDIKVRDCSNKTRKEGKEEEDTEISEVTDRLGGKMHVQYSLYIGDQKDVVHTIYLRIPENSSAFDVMRIAEIVDSKYKFLHRDMSGEMYIYEIAGIINDPEAGKFWLLYTGDHSVNGIAVHHTKSPDKFILGDGDHLIMWHRTAHI